jgi:hypothetical protein
MMSMMPSCEEVTRLKSDSMDSKLGLKKRFLVRFHMLFCKWCRRYEKQLELIRRASNKLKDSSDISLNPETKERFKNLLKE